MENQTEQSTYLFCTEGSSDKEYHAHLRRAGDSWVVQYANGPRGKVGQSKEKIAPCAYEVALKEYEKLVKSKIKGGYTPDQSGVRFTNTEHAQDASGHISQQPVAISDEEVAALLNDRYWFAQEKANGENRPVQISQQGVRGINKRGLYVNIPETWVREFAVFGDAAFDGEQVGDTLYIYDATRIGGRDLKEFTFLERYAQMEKAYDAVAKSVPSMKILRASTTKEGKQALLEGLHHQGGEGLVFKHIMSFYQNGKNKNTLKFKFKESVTCVVAQKNQQRSVQIGLLDSQSRLTDVGNVTIPEGAQIAEGDLIEVEYLYFNPGGAFEQPVYLGKRHDIARDECTFLQITRLKPGVEMDEDGQRKAPASMERQVG